MVDKVKVWTFICVKGHRRTFRFFNKARRGERWLVKHYHPEVDE